VADATAYATENHGPDRSTSRHRRPQEPTQIKRWIRDCNEYVKTPAGQALLESRAFIEGVPPTFPYELERALRAFERAEHQRKIDEARKRLRRSE
jgi:hypothetical protein